MLRDFSRSANNVAYGIRRNSEANLQTKCSDIRLAWVRNTKKRLHFIVKPQITHSFEAFQIACAIVHIRHILSFVVTKLDVKRLLSLAVDCGIKIA